MKKIITFNDKDYKGQRCPCHHATIWPQSAYDNHIERMRLIQSGEFDPYKLPSWRQRNNDRINRKKRRKEDLASGEERITNAF